MPRPRAARGAADAPAIVVDAPHPGPMAGDRTGALRARPRPGRSGPTRRLAVAVPGVTAGLLAAGLAAAAAAGTSALAAAVFVTQLLLGLAWLAAIGARGSGGAFLIVAVAAGVADGVTAAANTPDIGRAAAVGGVALVVGLFHQLVRRPRAEVTGSLTGSVSAVALALCGTAYVALRMEGGGGPAGAAALLGAGAALVAARLVDVVLARPVAVPGGRRGAPGLLVGVGVAVAVGAGWGDGHGVLGASVGIRIAVIAALLALIADLVVDVVIAAAPPEDDRARSALVPLGILLPAIVTGPGAYVAGRILLG